MKKVIGILFLIVILIATTALAAYPEDLENAELEQTKEDNITTLTDEQLENAEDLIQTPASDGSGILEATEKVTEGDVDLHEGDLYEMNSDVTISKMVNGNVYVMGQNVTFENAVIYGNAFVLGQNVEIKNSEINGSLYVACEKISFSGTTNDLYACGADIVFNNDAHIWRDVKVVGENVKLNGSIGRNVYAGAENLIVDEGTIVTGELNYASENEASISDKVQIANINFEKQESSNKEETIKSKFNPMSYVSSLLTTIIKTVIIALLVVLFIDKFNKLNRSENIAGDLLKNAGIGALVLILMPIISIVLIFTILASGIGLVVLLGYIIAIYISSSLASIEVATIILNKMKKDQPVSNKMKIGCSVLVGIALYLIGLIPALGGIVKFAFVLIGLGVLFNLLFKKNKVVE